jgi:hypothetical protein
VELTELNPIFFDLAELLSLFVKLIFNPFWIIFLKNAQQEFFMFLKSSQLIEILVDFTFNSLDVSLIFLDFGLSIFSLLNSKISFLGSI